MNSCVAYYSAIFAVILTHSTNVSVGQCTTKVCENGDLSMNIEAEAQEPNVEVFRQLGAILTSLQAIDQRRLQEHEIYIEQSQSMHKLFNESFSELKNQHGSIITNLQAVDRRRLREHDIYIRQSQSMRKLFNESFLEIKNQLATVVTSLRAVNRRLQEHDISIKNHNAWKLANGICGPTSEVCDCSGIKASGQNASGVYVVCAGRQRDRVCANAFCDMDTATGASLVFQRRKDGSVNFYRTWAEYKEGFGDSNEEFWLGNEMLHLLTSKRNYKLRIDLEDWEGNKRYAEYGRFSISSFIYNYTLTVGGYSGNAGDGLRTHNGQQFSTKDADNDKVNGSISCAVGYQGAWWYSNCHDSNLNGIYNHVNHSAIAKKGDGIVWSHWLGAWYSLKSTEMKLVPVA